MRHDKLERQLELLQLLAENRSYTASMLCQRLDIRAATSTTILNSSATAGSLSRSTASATASTARRPFFSRLFHRVAFSETEAVALRQLLSQADSHNAVLEGISRKLDRFYDFDILANDERRQRNARHVGVIYQAIKLRQMAVLKGYSSPPQPVAARPRGRAFPPDEIRD